MLIQIHLGNMISKKGVSELVFITKHTKKILNGKLEDDYNDKFRIRKKY